MNEQLKEFSTNSMLETMCPSLSALAKVCLTIPAFSSQKIVIESPQSLSDEKLEQIIYICLTFS